MPPTDAPPTPSTALAQLQAIDPRKANVLMPVISVEGDAISEALISSIQMIQINTDEARGEVYHDPIYAPKNKGKAALTALGLAKIAAAAGIQWEASEVEMRERRPDGHVYVRIRVTAAVRQPNGELYRVSAAKHLDTADWAEQRAAQYARYKDPVLTPGEIQEKVARDVLQFRAFVDERAETGAKNRAIRQLLQLQPVLEVRALQLPFAVPRLLYRPATAMALEEGSRAASSALYGAGAGASGMPPARPEAGAGSSLPAGSGTAGSRSERPPGKPEAGPDREEAPATAGDPSGPAEGLDDVRIADHDNMLMSEIAQTDPTYLEDLAKRSSGAPAKTRALAEAWLNSVRPKLA